MADIKLIAIEMNGGNQPDLVAPDVEYRQFPDHVYAGKIRFKFRK
jgi:hypothetical protein